MLGQLFTIGSTMALAGWVLLILAPTWRGIAQAISGVVIPALLGLAYTVLIAVWWSRGAGGFGSIEEVRALFGSTSILVAGWFHYLAFDLLTGAWIARDARREGLAHALVVPALLLTFMVGPIGYIAYLGLRTAWRAARPRSGRSRLGSLWPDFAARDPVLVATGILFWLAMLPTGLAYALDERVFQGVDVWLKPLKFELALGLFALTLAWFMPMASEAFRRSWAGRYVAWGFAMPATFEIVYVAWRASRGEASHFNTSTPVASALYGLMGVGAIILTSTSPVLAWGVARNRSPISPAYRLAVVLGLSLTFVLGAFEGLVMSMHGSHAVGAAAAGDAGLPLFGWLRSAGDLRVAHFLGIHVQQILPVFGALATWLLAARARPVVLGFAALYSGLVLALFVEAMMGRPLLPM
ncbi:MAG TPA: ABA4-like family protein [Lichenihabitans sp.]|jgi:hypothetical protein|nr:ABA4-like family protein [Lichenihabitans sp.]